jgi:iron-sulfur cluster assembly protein
VEVDGLPLIVNDKSLALVQGTVIDFQRQGLNASFVFHNPNATGECGCGESFTVG